MTGLLDGGDAVRDAHHCLAHRPANTVYAVTKGTVTGGAVDTVCGN